MTQVLSVNPSLDREGGPLLPFPTKTSKASLMESGGPKQQLVEGLPCRQVPDHVTLSRIAYIKRKYVEDEDSFITFRSYCKTVAPVLEERAQVLRLSLEKLRFIDYPEAFLRRSVLVNNLLHRLRSEILLQSDWCLPPGLRVPAAFPSYVIPPADAATPCLAFHGSLPPPCLTAQQPPLRKRFRLIRGNKPVANSCPPHSTSIIQLGTAENRLGGEFDVDEEDDDGDEEGEERGKKTTGT